MASISKLMNVKVPAPKRSNFDLSHRSPMTIAPGLLYPVYVEEILPGDDIEMSVETRLKTQAMLAPVLGGMDCTYYHFFCPLRNYVPQMNLNVKQVEFFDEFTMPTFTFPSDDNIVYMVGVGGLLDCLGFPIGMNSFALGAGFGVELTTADKTFNAASILCYYDIWRNYFANPQADYVPYYKGFSVRSSDLDTFGVDALLSRNYYDVFGVGDFDVMFTELSQGVFADSTLESNQIKAYLFDTIDLQGGTQDFISEYVNIYQSYSSHAGLLPVTYHDDMFVARLNSSYVDYVKQQVRVDTQDGYFTIDSLRMANKLAKFVDKTLLGGTRYGQWLKSHFAVNGMEHLNIPIFLGMDRMSLYFDDVVSQADTGNSQENGNLGSVGGRGSVHYPNTNKVNFYAKEHGYFMTLVALRPRVHYFQGLPKYLQKTQFSDIYVPELDAVGWQPILQKDMYYNTEFRSNLTGQYVDPNGILGYSPAWIEYMTRVDTVHGQFATSLDYWVFLRRFGSVEYDYINEDNALFIDTSTYVDPQDYNNAFAGDTPYYDNFYLNQYFEVYIKRNISKQILPSL